MSKLGIISGGGDLPHIAFASAVAMGFEPVYLPILESDFHCPFPARPQYPIRIASIGNVLKLCKKLKLCDLYLIGKVEKEKLYQIRHFDVLAVTLLAKMKTKGDYSIFHTVADEFAKSGIHFQSQKKLLGPNLLPEGRYTKKSVTASELENILFGIQTAESIANLDIGQSVVVYDGNVIAIEAVEGTDAMVERAGYLLNRKNKKGGILCKSSRSSQDPRFDLPAIGEGTIESMKKAGLNTIAIRSGDTLVINPKATIELCEKHKIHFVSVTPKTRKEHLAQQKKIHS